MLVKTPKGVGKLSSWKNENSSVVVVDFGNYVETFLINQVKPVEEVKIIPFDCFNFSSEIN